MLKTRIITALVLLPIVLAALFFLSGSGWAIFALAVCVIGSWEWTRLSGWQGGKQWAYVGLTALFGLALIATDVPHPVRVTLSLLSLGFWPVVAPLWLHRKWRLSGHAFAPLIGWLLLLGSWQAMVLWHERENGPWILLAILAVAWVADTAAYFAGRAFGKHKLAPSISPGKSWEGVVGAYIGITAYGFLLLRSPLGPQFGGMWIFPALWVLTGLSVVGDLLESLFKRQIGIKDSSNLLPGHGGILDRIDSQLAVLPVSAALLTLAQLAQ
ncbi:phosphatidate cytidylyltransferase [Chitinivorax sp. PXF-14]|uniref:phosphatidate cytidylyltransferase n=1 Tax=Chitinivorax sp. PXF-14 TaxID=3230488 RepID=UPI003466D939